MTTTAATRTRTSHSDGYFAHLSETIRAYLTARARRRTLLALSDLQDHVLHDIGFNPGEIRSARRTMTDWVVQTQSGTSRLLFIGH